MSQNLVWMFGAGTLVAGAAVATFLATGLREETAGPASDPAPLVAQDQPAPVPDGLVDEPAAASDVAIVPTPAPQFDVVRVARDGGALVAGEAAPGAAVTLRLDGAEVAQTSADGAGQFVTLFSLPPSDTAQMLTLEMRAADGAVTQSEDTVILTPRPAPQVIVAAPEASIAETVSGAVDPVAATPQIDVAQAGPVIEAPQIDMTASEPQQVAASEPPEVVAAADVPALIADEVVEPVQTAALDALTAAPVAAPEGAQGDVQQSQSEPVAEPVARLAAAPTAEPVADPITNPTPEPALEPTVIAAVEAPQAAPEADMPTAFLVRGSGAVEVLDRAPQVMDNVVIDSISYSADGDVQIAGRAARALPEANLRIYLNNQPIAVARSGSDGWASDLPHVDPGVYTLRVDQISDAGQVVSRFETPFQREDPDRVAAAQTATDAAPVSEAVSEPLLMAAPAPPPATSESGNEVVEIATAPVQDLVTRAQTSPSATPPVSLITVQPGHTLWAISNERYGAGELYVVIYRANSSQIRDPDMIYPGQVFALPDN